MKILLEALRMTKQNKNANPDPSILASSNNIDWLTCQIEELWTLQNDKHKLFFAYSRHSQKAGPPSPWGAEGSPTQKKAERSARKKFAWTFKKIA